MSTDSQYKEPINSKQHQPEYILPTNILNVAYLNQIKKQAEERDEREKNQSNSQVKHNYTANYSNGLLDNGHNSEKSDDEQINMLTNYGNEISKVNMRKIDEIKAKLDALNKKYAAEAGWYYFYSYRSIAISHLKIFILPLDNALEKTFTNVPKKQISFKEVRDYGSQRASDSNDSERQGASSRLSQRNYNPLG
jgi:hypothetical protein